jgi:hypothetical protein
MKPGEGERVVGTPDRMSDEEFESFLARLQLHADRYLPLAVEARRARERELELERRLTEAEGALRQLETAREQEQMHRLEQSEWNDE